MFKDFIIFPPENMNKLRIVSEVIVPSVPVVHIVSPVVFKTSDEGSLAVVDKKNAHSLYELMIVNSSDKVKETILDLNGSEYASYFQMIQSFFTYLCDIEVITKFKLNNGIPRVVFNFDPETDDRDSLQPVKRFHSHLYILTEDMIKHIKTNRIEYRDIKSPFSRRRMVDPLCFLSENLLFDLFSERIECPRNVDIIEPNHFRKVEMGGALGLNIVLKDGLKALKDIDILDFFYEVFTEMSKAFNQLRDALFGMNNGVNNNERRILRNLGEIREKINELTWLTENSRNGLVELASFLKPVSKKLLLSQGHHLIKANYLLSKGLAYTFSITAGPIKPNSECAELRINISPRFFSDIGGAGLFGCEGVSAILLKRGEGVFTELELSQRWEFQKELQNYMTKIASDSEGLVTIGKMTSGEINKMLNVYYHNKEIDGGPSPKLVKNLVDFYRKGRTLQHEQ